MSKLNLKPLGNRVIVERFPEEEVTEGGIVIPEKAAVKPVKGTVLAVGPGKYLDTGDLVETGLNVGDVVLFGINAGEELEVDKQKILVLNADEILATETND